MGTLENKALRTHQNISIYRRYVDDTCIVTTNRNEANIIFETLNNQHRNIKFEIEYPSPENSLSLLDFQFRIDQQGNVTFNFYQKAAKKPLFPHESSALPKRTKYNIAYNEIERRLNRCTSDEDKRKEKENFEKLLRSNDYDNTDLRRIFSKNKEPNHQRNQPILTSLTSTKISTGKYAMSSNLTTSQCAFTGNHLLYATP